MWENPFGFAGFLMQISKFMYFRGGESWRGEPGVGFCVGLGLMIGVCSLYYAGTDVVYGCDLCDVVEDVCVFLFDLGDRRETDSVDSVLYLGPQYGRFSPKLYYWIFIPCDIFSLCLQAVGGALSSTSSGSSNIAVDVSQAGLSFQVFTLVVFIALAVDYALRYIQAKRVEERKTPLPASFKVFVAFLSLAVVLILIRCAYRIDELSDGYSGPLIHNEGLFIGLEGV